MDIGLAKYVKGMIKAMKVLNFGSLNIDFVYSVDHFVRAGETLSSDRLEKFCGGKGLNQAVALARAGATVFHAGCVGADGGMLKALLAESGADTRFIRQTDDASGHAIIQVDKKGQNCILLYGGANQQITDDFVDEVLASCEKGDVLLLQNEINNLPYIVEKAFACGMEIALNPSPINSRLAELPLDKVRYFILNEIEGTELTGETDPEKILEAFRRKYPHSVVVLTLGKHGAVYDDGATRCHHGIYDVPVVDTTAAGDTFTGYFLTCITSGKSPEEALRIASVASSLAVSAKGAAPSIPTMETVLKAELKPC